MSKNPNIKISDLIGDAVENAIARREQSLTTEETQKVKGGFVTAGGRRAWPWPDPSTIGMTYPPDPIQS